MLTDVNVYSNTADYVCSPRCPWLDITPVNSLSVARALAGCECRFKKNLDISSIALCSNVCTYCCNTCSSCCRGVLASTSTMEAKQR